MNLLDLSGPAFLKLYLCIGFAAAIAAVILRYFLAGQGDGRSADLLLSAYDIAYLNGGQFNVVRTALVSLVHRGALSLSAGSEFRVQTSPLVSLPMPELSVLNLVRDGEANQVRTIKRRARAITQRIRDELTIKGLACTSQQSLLARIVPGMLMLCVVILGIAKIAVGVSRNRPVGFLLCLTAIAIGATMLFLAKVPYQTAAGRRLLLQMRREHEALKLSSRLSSKRLSPTDIAMAVSLFGPIAISSAETARLKTLLWGSDISTGSSSGNSYGCGGSSGCGGGGCGGGGGGGGGGGCGGCGGH